MHTTTTFETINIDSLDAITGGFDWGSSAARRAAGR